MDQPGKCDTLVDVVRGTVSFFYYVSPLGYLFDNAKHNLTVKLFSEVQ